MKATTPETSLDKQSRVVDIENEVSISRALLDDILARVLEMRQCFTYYAIVTKAAVPNSRLPKLLLFENLMLVLLNWSHHAHISEVSILPGA